jgi:hypothetical protein
MFNIMWTFTSRLEPGGGYRASRRRLRPPFAFLETERSGSGLERVPFVADTSLGQLSDHVAEGPAVIPSNLFDLFVQVRLEMYSDNLGAALG